MPPAFHRFFLKDKIRQGSLNKCALKLFNLRNNYIGNTGAKDIATALRANTTLTMLDLSKNNIGDAGWKALVEALQANGYITDLGQAIENSIKDARLKTTLIESLARNKNNAAQRSSLLTFRLLSRV
ncbi:MAG: hypothetical protein K2P51_08095 [Rhabdochlamydiaceae bacterium]|nr:hypothetical protein [Rhabdochlamydiaceae bacterium]